MNNGKYNDKLSVEIAADSLTKPGEQSIGRWGKEIIFVVHWPDSVLVHGDKFYKLYLKTKWVFYTQNLLGQIRLGFLYPEIQDPSISRLVRPRTSNNFSIDQSK